jgi:hypothetical protein
MEVKKNPEENPDIDLSINDPEGFQNIVFTKKMIETIKRDSSFEREEKKIEEQFFADLQLASFSDLSQIENLKIFVEAGKYKNNVVIFIFGHLFPSDKKLMEKLFYVFIKLADSKLKE